MAQLYSTHTENVSQLGFQQKCWCYRKSHAIFRPGRLTRANPLRCVDKLAENLQVGMSFKDRFFTGIFSMKRRIVSILSHPVASMLEYTPPSDLRTVLKSESGIESNSDSHAQNNDKTFPIRIVKRVTFTADSEVSVSVTSCTAGLVYIPMHPDCVCNQMVLPAWAIANGLPSAPAPILVSNLSKKPMNLPKGMSIGVRTVLPEVIVLVWQSEITPRKIGRMRKISLLQTQSHLLITERKSGEMDRWKDIRESETSMEMNWKLTGEPVSA